MKKSFRTIACLIAVMGLAVACNNNNQPAEVIDTVIAPIDTVVAEPVDTVVVEEVGANGTTVERAGGRHVVAVAVRLREVNHGVGDRAGTGDVACGEVVSVEVERLAGIHRDLPKYLVVDKDKVVEGLVDQRVGERAGAGTLRLEAAAHGVVEADGAAGVLRGDEVELQRPRRVIDLERIEEVGRPVPVGGCGAGGVRCKQAELRADREAGGDSERAVRHLRARKGVCDRNRPGITIGDDGVLRVGDDGIALLDGDGGGGRVGIGRAFVVECRYRSSQSCRGRRPCCYCIETP